MKKAFLILTVIVFFSLSILSSLPSAYAVNPTNMVILNKLVRGVGEKLGLSFTQESLSTAVERLLEKKNSNVDYDVDWIGSIPVLSAEIGSPLETEDLLLDPKDYLPIMNDIKEVNDDLQEGNQVSFSGKCLDPVINGVTHTKWIRIDGSNHYDTYIVWSGSNILVFDGVNRVKTPDNIYTNLGSWTEWQYNGSAWVQQNTGYNSKPGSWVYSVKSASYDTSCIRTVTPSMVINTGNASPVFANLGDGDMTATYVNSITINNDYSVNDFSTTYNTVVTPEDLAEAPPDPNAYPDDPNDTSDDPPAGSKWWEWLLGPLKAIGDFFKDVGGFLLGILVPSADSVTGIFDGITDSFKAKIPIADQLGSFFGEIEQVTVDEPTAPTFNVTMPMDWGGGTFSIIDFSYFAEWRTWILNFIRFTAWFIFLKRLYNRIPKMVY